MYEYLIYSEISGRILKENLALQKMWLKQL